MGVLERFYFHFYRFYNQFNYSDALTKFYSFHILIWNIFYIVYDTTDNENEIEFDEGDFLTTRELKIINIFTIHYREKNRIRCLYFLIKQNLIGLWNILLFRLCVWHDAVHDGKQRISVDKKRTN